MLRLDLQFYAFFTIVLSGAVLGLLYDVLRVTREYYRPAWWVAAGADLSFWVVATAALSGGLFLANWAELRFYVLIGIATGVGLYLWLASPVVRGVLRLAFRALEWVAGLVASLARRLIWYPLVAFGGLIWAVARNVFNGILGLARLLARAAGGLGWLIVRPFRGLYRCGKLHYLLALRRWRHRRRR